MQSLGSTALSTATSGTAGESVKPVCGLTIRSSRHRFVASPLRLRYASAKLSPLRGAA